MTLQPALQDRRRRQIQRLAAAIQQPLGPPGGPPRAQQTAQMGRFRRPGIGKNHRLL